MKKLFSILLTMTICLAAVPALTGTAYAASGPAQVKSFAAKATSQSNIKLTWKKVNGATGYAIYRNNKLIKKVSAKTLAYNDSKLKPVTKYKYYVRAYKTTTVKKWYNKSTKKYQVSRPAKAKDRGYLRTFTVNTYGKASVAKTVATQKKAQTITASNKTVNAGKTVSLGAKASSGFKMTYKSSNTAVATVNANGVVTGKKAGTAKITITQAGNGTWKAASKTVTITVKAVVSNSKSNTSNDANSKSNTSSNSESSVNDSSGSGSSSNGSSSSSDGSSGSSTYTPTPVSVMCEHKHYVRINKCLGKECNGRLFATTEYKDGQAISEDEYEVSYDPISKTIKKISDYSIEYHAKAGHEAEFEEVAKLIADNGRNKGSIAHWSEVYCGANCTLIAYCYDCGELGYIIP